jgi:hypothetical protein
MKGDQIMKTDKKQSLNEKAKGVSVKTNLKAGRRLVGPQEDLP